MARMTLTIGSCPVCGMAVGRTISTHHGIALEHYNCPLHGRQEAAPHDAIVSEWARPRSMADLGELMQMPAPMGIQWVA